MSSTGTPVYDFRWWIALFATAVLGGCSITVSAPGNNASVTSPFTAVVTGNAAFSNLVVDVDGMDVSALMSATSSQRSAGNLILPVGAHTITASASVPCWYCGGGRTQSTSTRSFVVVSGSTSVCARNGAAPVISLDPTLANVGQQPGRQQIGYMLQSGHGVVILVDDAPGLLPTQMLVEIDLDPVRGVGRSKMVEAWGFCQSGTAINAVTSGTAGGFGTGVVCNPLTPANDFRSGCTTPSPPMLISQATTSELWLRKQGVLGNWDYAEGIDQSIWRVFGGRRLRFIWFGGD